MQRDFRVVVVTGLCALGWILPKSCLAECDAFIEWVADDVDRYHEQHRIHPIPEEIRALAVARMPCLWISPGSYHPVDFDDYLDRARLHAEDDGRVLAEPPVTEMIRSMSRVDQCRSYLDAGELPPADPAPVYIQAFRDDGPDGSTDWLYLKYTVVFDWSGLARDRSLLARMGAFLTGGEADRWHRFDVHTAATLGLDAERALRTVTLQQHNNRRTYVAGVDFEPADGVHLAAARETNELYLDSGSTQPQRRRAVPSFLQWKHLIDERLDASLAQVDEFVGRRAGGREVRLRPVFPAPSYPLASFAGLLAPKRRVLGVYVGRDGPPGFDFTGMPRMPDAVALGYWQEGDGAFLEVLDRHLDGFRTTNWDAIRTYLAARLREALSSGGIR